VSGNEKLTTEDTESTETAESAGRRLARWWKFNMVGTVGMVVQLAMLAVLNRMTAHYLVSTAAAIEITLLHNFAWHLRYTWRDRRGEVGRVAQLARFHLSNGAVSMAGNLALMPFLVQAAHMPVIAANLVAILACSVVNFWLGDAWVFSQGSTNRTRESGAGIPSLEAYSGSRKEA